MKLGEYVFRKALAASPQKTVFGIPGDFALPLFRTLDNLPDVKVVTFTHEPALGYAADAFARLNGFAIAVVTYGAGGLNMVNAIAQAYAEKSPVLVISGGPELIARRKNLLVHHLVKNFETQKRVYDEVCCAATILERASEVVSEVDYVIQKILAYGRPGYIEIPRDLVDLELDVSAVDFSAPKPQIAAVRSPQFFSVIEEIEQRINSAQSPVVYAGVEVRRLALQPLLEKFLEQTGISFTTSMEGKAVISENHPQFVGTYMGSFGSASSQAAMDDADLIINIGTILTDVNLGLFTGSANITKMIHLTADGASLDAGGDAGVSLRDALTTLVERKRITKRTFSVKHLPAAKRVAPTSGITTDGIIAVINDFVAQVPTTLVLDVGDILFSSCTIHSDMLIAPCYYASMGFAVPGAVSACLANPDRKTIALVGDGAFQMTGAELGVIKRYDLTPLIIVMNNNGYETMRAFDAKREAYNVPQWDFVAFAEALGVAATRVSNIEQLQAVIEVEKNSKRALLVEAVMQPGDVSTTLGKMKAAFQLPTS